MCGLVAMVRSVSCECVLVAVFADIFFFVTGKHDVGSLSKDGRHHSYAHSAHSARNHRSSSFQNLAYS